MYLRLFHGRDYPEAELSDWGFDGPIIGNVGVSWTYGTIKVISEDGDFFFLLIYADLVQFDGKFYGDFELIETYDFKKNWRSKNLTLISFARAKEIVEIQGDPDDDEYDEMLPF